MDFEDDVQSEDIPSSGEEDNQDERKHNQLLDALSSLDGKKRNKLSQRTVISTQVSEFNFTSSKDNTSVVRLNELVGSLKESTSHGELKNQLRNINRNKKTVSTPLPRHEKEKIDRATAYETTTEDVSKWDPIVRKNRKADQIQFPLEKPDFKIVTTDQLVKRFQPRTPLERQVAELLQGSDSVVQNKEQELTPAEQKALQAMDVKEAKERRMELMKYRALLSYKEAKAKRQKKIKSKKFHRILKKEKLKNEKKHLDKLQEEDPEGYLDKLNQIEKDRAQERVSLKHRGGSKFAKRQMIYAKYDDRARQEVQDMLQKSRTLTKKVDVDSDSEDEKFLDAGVTIDNTEIDNTANSDNPWMARPSSRKPNVSYSRPAAINDSDDETEQSEYSRPTEVINKEAGGNDVDESEEPENEKNDVDDVDVIEIESNEENEETVIPVKKKQETEVHDLSSLDTEQFAMEANSVKTTKSKLSKEIDEIFETKANVGKLSKNQRKKRNKNKSLVDKNSKTEKAKSAEHEKKSKKDVEVDRKSDIDADSDDDNDIESDSGDVTTKSKKKVINEEDIEEADYDEVEQMNNESLSRKRTLEEFEEMLSDNSTEEITTHKKAKTDSKNKKRKQTDQQEKNVAKEAFVDPKKLFTIENKIRQVGSAPNVVDTENDNEIDAEEQQRLTIAQAFADDDVIEEFSREKEDAVVKGKPKDIDLTLPGWGSWGGDGIKVSTKKRKRFTIKAPPPLPRKDGHLGHVILNESRMAAVAKHMVHEIPFPYRSTEQFEKSIRAPLGKTWNPEAVHKDLVKPRVITSLGKIINPINKSEVSKYLKHKAKSDVNFKSDSEKHNEKVTKHKKPVKRIDKPPKGNFKSQHKKSKNSAAKHGKGKK